MKCPIWLILVVFCLFGIELALADNSVSIHKKAELTGQNKIDLLLQRFGRAIEMQDFETLLSCIVLSTEKDALDLDNLRHRFKTAALVLHSGSHKNLAGAFRYDTMASAKTGQSKNGIGFDYIFRVPEVRNIPVCHTSIIIKNINGVYRVTNIGDILSDIKNWGSRLTHEQIAQIIGCLNIETKVPKNTDDIIPNMLTQLPFYTDAGGKRTISVFTRTEAQNNLEGRSLFNRPYDILETVIYDPGLGDLWGIIATDANWDRFIALGNLDYSDQPAFLMRDQHGGPQYDPDNINYDYIAGTSLLNDQDLYVCDVHNNQVGVYWYDMANRQLYDMNSIGGEIYNGMPLSDPIDVDAAHIPLYLPGLYQGTAWYMCSFRDFVAVCDRGNNRVLIFTRDGGYVCSLGGETAERTLNAPSSVAFGRDEQTGWPRFDVYIIDAGNKRIVKYSCSPYCTGMPPDYSSFLSTEPGIFEPDGILCSIDIDAFGQVYVLDMYHGYIYKFRSDLTFLGKWGGFGTDASHLYHPSRLTITRGWHNEYVESCQEEIIVPSRMGDILITDAYTDSTGIKRYRFNNSMYNLTLDYNMRDCNIDTLTGDNFELTWSQIDYGRIEVDFSIVGMGMIEQYSVMHIPGQHYLRFDIPYDAPTLGTYGFVVRLYSPYGNELLQQEAYGGVYDRGDCNYPPVIDTTFIVGNDSCFMHNAFIEYVCSVAVRDNDHDLENLTYTWTTTPGTIGAFCFYSDSMTADSILATATTTQNKITLCVGDWGDAKADAASPKDTALSIFGVLVTDTVGDWAFRKHYMPFGQGDYTCEPDTPYTGGCPILYYDDGGRWRLINNLLAEGELRQKSGEYVSEIYPVYDISTGDDGLIRLRITEETGEITTLRTIRAMMLTIPESEQAIYTINGSLYGLTGHTIDPILAYTARGDTVTNLIDKDDGTAFSDYASGELYIEYSINPLIQGYDKSMSSVPGGPNPIPPDKGMYKRQVSAGKPNRGCYEYSALTSSGEWQSVGRLFPRLIRENEFIEMSQYIVDGRLAIRVDYIDNIDIDWLPYYQFKPLDGVSEPLRLESAKHNKYGDLTALASRESGPDIVLDDGEYVDLVFRGHPAKTGYSQVLLLAVSGKYETGRQNRDDQTRVSFDQNYPNPFNPNTNFSFYLPQSFDVNLTVYNVLGQTVRVLANDRMEPGRHNVMWDSKNSSGKSVASGVYFARFTAGEYSVTRKVEVVK